MITPAPGTAGGDGHHGRPARADPHRGDHARPSPEPGACTSRPSRVSCYGHHRPGGAPACVTARTPNANGCDQGTMRVRLMRATRVRCRAGLAYSPGPGRQEAPSPASVAGSRLDGSGPGTTPPVAGVSASRRTVTPQAGTGITGAFGTRACRAAKSARPPFRPSGLRSRQRRPGARAGAAWCPCRGSSERPGCGALVASVGVRGAGGHGSGCAPGPVVAVAGNPGRGRLVQAPGSGEGRAWSPRCGAARAGRRWWPSPPAVPGLG